MYVLLERIQSLLHKRRDSEWVALEIEEGVCFIGENSECGSLRIKKFSGVEEN